MNFDALDYDPALACDLAEIARERDRYAAQARDLRAHLAAALTVQAGLADTIAELRARLHAAGPDPTGAHRKTGAALLAA